ncbi:hypothetical protein ABZP36_026876 [Zizania latifolia]
MYPERLRLTGLKPPPPVTTLFSPQTPFGYTRKDVLLIGVGVTLFGYGLKYGLEVTSVPALFSIATPVCS